MDTRQQIIQLRRINLKKYADTQYKQYLYKKFQDFPIICSLGVKHLWPLKEQISNTFPKTH